MRCEGCKRRARNAAGRRWYAANRAVQAARVADWRARNPDKVRAYKGAVTSETQRDWYLRSRYGITLADERAMYARQGGGCALQCGRPIDRENRAVDHDHETGEVRGLLCRQCNSALGAFEDDPERLLIAYAYLTASNRPWVVRTTKESDSA